MRFSVKDFAEEAHTMMVGFWLCLDAESVCKTLTQKRVGECLSPQHKMGRGQAKKPVTIGVMSTSERRVFFGQLIFSKRQRVYFAT